MQRSTIERNASPVSRESRGDRLTVRLIIGIDRRIYQLSRKWLSAFNSLFVAVIAAAFLAPIFVSVHFASAARPIYAIFGLVCHQQDKRSFHLFGQKMACCQRCAAIYGSIAVFGLLFGMVRHELRRPRPVELAALAAPVVVDGALVGVGYYDGNWVIRSITGILFGFATIWLLYPRFESGFAEIQTRLETLFARLSAEGRATPLPR